MNDREWKDQQDKAYRERAEEIRERTVAFWVKFRAFLAMQELYLRAPFPGWQEWSRQVADDERRNGRAC